MRYMMEEIVVLIHDNKDAEVFTERGRSITDSNKLYALAQKIKALAYEQEEKERKERKHD